MDIREEIILQTKELYKSKENKELYFCATTDGEPLTYGVKFIREFDVDLMLICRLSGGEAVAYSLEYINFSNEDPITEGFDMFDDIYDMTYIWCEYRGYNIGEDSKGIYVGQWKANGNGDDDYEECKVLKRVETVNEAKEYINNHYERRL